MNSSRHNKKQKSNGQAMVEFALALPILLTLLYGLLETGRLLFIYASTVTAARQAVRYGSATGESPNGMPYYMDCGGIEAAARQVGFINTFESVTISYDGGLDSNNGNPLPLDPANPTCGNYTDANVQNGDRIIVEVTAQWVPIVSIVPLEPFTITSQSERTILASVSISVTSVPQGWQNSGNGILTLSISVSPTTYSTVGQTITYTYTLKNTGSGDLSAPFTVTDNVAATNCSGAPATLASGGSFTCTGTYQVTQSDLDTGTVTNTATASANGSPSNTVSKTITAIQSPALSLSKSASPTASSTVGAIITYTYTLRNTGNVSLTSPYAVADNKIASVNCSGAASPLAPTATTTCTASYSITNNDITNGSVVNQAVASAKFKTTTITSNNATATVLTPPLVLAISVSPLTATLPNQVITYTFSVLNNSAFTANSLSVTDSRITVTCPSTTLAAGSTINCTGTYTVTQADLDVGGTISNSAQAAANNGSPISSNTVTASLVITQTPALSATVSGTPSQPTSPSITLPAGTLITYTYTLTNTGNVTLTSPFSVTDNKITITCSDQASLAPASTKTCSGTYTVTAADVEAGSIINTGTASAKFSAQTITSSPASFTVITYSGARFSLAVTQNKTVVTPADLTITYTYTLTNTGGVTLSKPYSITSSLQSTLLIAGTGGSDTTTPISPDCTAAAASIAPGISTNCSYTYAHPSGTGSSTLVHSTSAASIGGTSVTSLPAALTATVYNCTASNFTVGTLTVGSGGNSDKVTWAITNKVGLTLLISSVSINWANSGPGRSDWQLDGVLLDNSSSLTTGTLPDSSSPYTSGSGTLTGSSSAPSMTTITFDFSKNNPTGLSASITMASPYGNCSR